MVTLSNLWGPTLSQQIASKVYQATGTVYTPQGWVSTATPGAYGISGSYASGSGYVSPQGTSGSYSPSQIPSSLVGHAYDSVWDAQTGQYVTGSSPRGQAIIADYYASQYAAATQSASEKAARDLATREAALAQEAQKISGQQASYESKAKQLEVLSKKPSVTALPYYGKFYGETAAMGTALQAKQDIYNKLALDFNAWARGRAEQETVKQIEIMRLISPDAKYGRTGKGQIIRTGGISAADYGKEFYITKPVEAPKPTNIAEETFFMPPGVISLGFQEKISTKGLPIATGEVLFESYGKARGFAGKIAASSLFWLPEETKKPLFLFPIDAPATKIITGAKWLVGGKIREPGEQYSFGWTTKAEAQEAARMGGETLFDWFTLQEAGKLVAEAVKPTFGFFKDAKFFNLESPKGNVSKFFVTGKTFLEPAPGKIKGALSKIFYGAGKEKIVSGTIDVKTLAKYTKGPLPFGVRITAKKEAFGKPSMEIMTKALSTKQLAKDFSLAEKQRAVAPFLERGIYAGRAEFKELTPNVLKNIFGGKQAKALFSKVNSGESKAIKFKYGQTGRPIETSLKIKLFKDEYNKIASQYVARIKGEIVGKKINILENIFRGKQAKALFTKTKTKEPYFGYAWQKIISQKMPEGLGIKIYAKGKLGGAFKFKKTGFTSIIEPSNISVIQRFAAQMPKGKIGTLAKKTPFMKIAEKEALLPQYAKTQQAAKKIEIGLSKGMKAMQVTLVKAKEVNLQALGEKLTAGAAKMVEKKASMLLKTGAFGLAMPKIKATVQQTQTGTILKITPSQVEKSVSIQRPFEKTRQLERVRTAQRIGFEMAITPAERTRVIERTREKQMERLAEKTVLSEKIAEKTMQKIAQRTLSVQKIVTPQKIKMFTLAKMAPITPIPPPKFPVLKFPPIGKGIMPTALKAFVKGYDIFVKRQGKIFKLSSKPLPRLAALSLGAGWAERTAGASFYLHPSKAPAVKSSLKDWLALAPRFYKGKKGAFVEKTMFRISTPGELQEITFRGIAASKTAKKMQKTLLFGKMSRKRGLSLL